MWRGCYSRVVGPRLDTAFDMCGDGDEVVSCQGREGDVVGEHELSGGGGGDRGSPDRVNPMASVCAD